VLAALIMAAAQAAATPLPNGQFHYTQSCGGCHGLLGDSARRDVPHLQGRVGYFLCSREGREYVVRLPNVAFAAMDDQNLADALNFMMFGLGGSSVPADQKALLMPFTAREVHPLRERPFKARDLVRLRDEAMAKADAHCLSRSKP
jgi:hypothetical protein